MLLPILLPQAAPRDLTPKDARARDYAESARLAARKARLHDLDRFGLTAGDIEVRYWGGFARGTQAAVLYRRRGEWTASQLITVIPFRLRPLPDPKLGWPAFWAEAERLGIFTLPDQEQAGSKRGYSEIMDGYSTLVEFQKEGVYRAYAYNNPTHQTTWPPAKRMAALDAFIRSQFPTW